MMKNLLAALFLGGTVAMSGCATHKSLGERIDDSVEKVIEKPAKVDLRGVIFSS